MCIADQVQATSFSLGEILHKWAEDQFPFQTKGSIILYRLYLKKLYILVGNDVKKFKISNSQGLLYWKGYFIGYQKHFKWFDLMVRFKSYAYFYEGRWKQLGPILHPLRLTARCT